MLGLQESLRNAKALNIERYIEFMTKHEASSTALLEEENTTLHNRSEDAS